jgi:hypothetical protein
MLIHCTKNLATRLPGVSPQPLADDHPLGSWHAHHYTIDHRNCVLFCHDTTRFTLFLAGLKKQEFQDLSPWFHDLFLNTLLRLGCETELIRKAADLLDALRFDTHTDRSVLATLNIAKGYDLDALLWQVPNVLDLPPYSISARLCQRPIHLKGMRTSDCLWPDRAMQELLRSL